MNNCPTCNWTPPQTQDNAAKVRQVVDCPVCGTPVTVLVTLNITIKGDK